jgi:hypothetical protein
VRRRGGRGVRRAVAFGASTGFDWRPCGVAADEEFGAQFLGILSVPIAGSYTFTLVSDDGSQLFIDGALVVNNGGAHGPATVPADALLTAGLHPFRVDFYECCQGAGGVDLVLPTALSIVTSVVPEPATLAVTTGGLLALAPLTRRRRR